MTADPNERVKEGGPTSAIRAAMTVPNAGMVLVGVLAGYSVSVLSADAVSLLLLGSVPGLFVGAAGLAVAAVGYRKIGCCGNCGCRTFGLSGGCEESCSYDP